MLEKIKCGLDPDSPHGDERLSGKQSGGRGRGPNEAQATVSGSIEPSERPDKFAPLRDGDKFEFRDHGLICDFNERGLHPPSNYVDTRDSTCAYREDEMVCFRCWDHYKHCGRRWTPDDVEEKSTDIEDSSDNEYSPFLFNF